MATQSIGKKFEAKFAEDWGKIDGTVAIRLYDQYNGRKETSKNPCDYVCFASTKLFLVECKEHKGKSFPFSEFPQYERMLEYKDKPNTFPILLVWLSECDRVFAVPIWEVEKMKADGKKSVNLQDFDKYMMYNIPSVKKRIFMDSDYTQLIEVITK